MRFSVWLSTGWTWNQIAHSARAVERAGWDGIWLPDHFMLPAGGYGKEQPETDPELEPVLEAWTSLAALAALVPRVTLGVLVSGVSYRNPAVLAKMAATVDHISDGRLIVGLGAGWQENEHRRYGIDFPDARERSDRLEEAAAVISALTGPAARSSFEGARYRLEDAPAEPKPIRSPLPLLIGGRGEQRTLRTAARFASHWNAWGTPEALARKRDLLADYCRAIARDPAEISISTNAMFGVHTDRAAAAKAAADAGERGPLIGTPSQIQERVSAYEAAGVDEMIIAAFNHSPQSFAPALDALARVVRPAGE